MPVAITVPELRVQLNLESEDDDTLLAQKIDAAEAYASSYIGSAIPDPAPAAIKQAVLMLAAFWYGAREVAATRITPYLALPKGHCFCNRLRNRECQPDADEVTWTD